MEKILNSKFYILSSKRGFTLIELLIFLAIFSVVIISFTTIFISVLRVYSKQSSSAEVNRQSQIVLQTLQYYIERSSLIEMPKDEATTTIKLRMAASSSDPTYIYLSSGRIYVKETDNGTPDPLTTDKVTISNASFTRRDNSPGHDSVDISFTTEYVTANLQHQFVQRLNTAIARVSAATFDSDLVASSTAQYDLGLPSRIWRSVNQIIWFSGSNVGIGPQSPLSKLHVTGGDVYVDSTTSGIILRDTNGVCWRVRVTIAGAFTSASITCP